MARFGFWDLPDGESSSCLGRICGCRYTLTEEANLLSVYVALGHWPPEHEPRPAKALIYDNAFNFIAVTNEVIVEAWGPELRWIRFDFPAPIRRAPGEYYLSVWAGGETPGEWPAGDIKLFWVSDPEWRGLYARQTIPYGSPIPTKLTPEYVSDILAGIYCEYTSVAPPPPPMHVLTVRSIPSLISFSIEKLPPAPPPEEVAILRAINIDSLMDEGGDYDNAQFIADHTDLYDTWAYQGDLVPQIHAIRPDLKVIVYRNIRAVYTTTGETEPWILKDANGGYIYNPSYPEKYFLCDVGNPDYQEYVANWIKSQCDQYGFNGVFADWGIDNGAGLTYGLSGDAVNPRTGELYTTDEWIEGTIAIAEKIKVKIGSKLYIGNGVHDGGKWLAEKETYLRFFELPIDGLMAEGCFRPDMSESLWKKSLDFMVWLQDNFLPQRPNGVFLPISVCRGASNEQIKFMFCSGLLGIKDFSKNYLWMSRATVSDYTQNLFKTNLGLPLGNYYESSGCHLKDFEGGVVVVNSTNVTQNVVVKGTTITMEARSGKIIV